MSLSQRKTLKSFLGKSQNNGQEDKTQRVMEVGRRTREEIVKWNQRTALRFQTGGRHQTSLTSLRGHPPVITHKTQLKMLRKINGIFFLIPDLKFLF